MDLGERSDLLQHPITAIVPPDVTRFDIQHLETWKESIKSPQHVASGVLLCSCEREQSYGHMLW